jgi:hypothetical protein
MYVPESHGLTDGRSSALLQTALRDAPSQVRADCVWLKAVTAFLPTDAGQLIGSCSNGRASKRNANISTVGLAEASATGNPQREFVRQVPRDAELLGGESRESADARRESLAVEPWEGY